jgi:predicted enzyme related to lactoylglutathione lyase
VSTGKTGRVLQMRLVVEAPDYEEAVAFYRDVLEISNPEQVAMIDQFDVGRRVAPRLRVAFEVTDVEGVTRDLVQGGAELVAEPTITPWQSRNARLEAPAGLQLTVFQELGDTTDA